MHVNKFSDFSLKFLKKESDTEYYFGSVQLKFRNRVDPIHTTTLSEKIWKEFLKSQMDDKFLVLQRMALQIFSCPKLK
jgi:hypothetical protein